jgi:hypothetical protein
MRRPRRPAHQLRIAIDCMPLETKRAMLDAIQVNSIIVGGYTDRSGGVCPMLAAHRNGGRTSFASFARAWDKYTRAGNGPRPARDRELRTLTTMLEASIAIDEVQGGAVLGEAIADHRQAQVDRAVREEYEAGALQWPDTLEDFTVERERELHRV